MIMEQKRLSDMSFRGMALWLKLREGFGDPKERLEQAGVRKGHAVLDFGCGIGSYTIPAAQIVGSDGVVYALDIHPIAIRTVEKRATRERLGNVKTILSDRDTYLPSHSVDRVLLYDVLHAVPDKLALLRELHRVLKPGGHLSVIPDHMPTDEFLETMSTENLFTLETQHGKPFEFIRNADT